MLVGLMIIEEDDVDVGPTLVVVMRLLGLLLESGEEKKQKSVESQVSPWIVTT